MYDLHLFLINYKCVKYTHYYDLLKLIAWLMKKLIALFCLTTVMNANGQLLKTDPNFIKYRISYLAENCGFTSHSAFATVFKNITGLID
mgnify:CR=1 FL=1